MRKKEFAKGIYECLKAIERKSNIGPNLPKEAGEIREQSDKPKKQ